MTLGNKYFLLSDALPPGHIPHILGRVVEDKSNPLRSYAPVEHNATDFIPTFVPEPLIWSNMNDFTSRATNWSIGGGLADLIKIEPSMTNHQGFGVSSSEMKNYSLPNTAHNFQKLMGNKLYATDVKALLKRSKSGQAYFVTGFVTAKNGSFNHFHVKSRKLGLEINAPVFAAVGGAIPLSKGISMQSSYSTQKTSSTSRSMTIEDEVVFAVSYDIIRSKNLFSKRIINAGPRLIQHGDQPFTPEEGYLSPKPVEYNPFPVVSPISRPEVHGYNPPTIPGPGPSMPDHAAFPEKPIMAPRPNFPIQPPIEDLKPGTNAPGGAPCEQFTTPMLEEYSRTSFVGYDDIDPDMPATRTDLKRRKKKKQAQYIPEDDGEFDDDDDDDDEITLVSMEMYDDSLEEEEDDTRDSNDVMTTFQLDVPFPFADTGVILPNVLDDI